MRHLFAVATLVFLSAAAGAATLEETFDRTFDVRPGALVFLSNTNGHITIHAWDQPRVRVIGEKKVTGTGDAARQAMAELKIEVTQSNGGLRVVTRYPKQDSGILDWMFGTHVGAGVTYDVTVPRTMDVEVENTNGAIEVADVRGSHRLGTTNGGIRLTHCAGDIDAETTNGRIRAELTDVTPGKSMRLETTNGGIELAAPRSLAAQIDAATTNGSINTDLPVTTTDTRRHTLRGTINGGGPELRLRTTNGSIEIRAAR